MSARRAKRYWLVKSEPDVYSIDDLQRDGHTMWDGVRNYQARNLMRDDMQVGDGVLFYHSRVKPMCVAGTAKVTRAGYPDPTQFDPKSKYFDPKSSPEAPRWQLVDVRAIAPVGRFVSLKELREDPLLEDLELLRRGNRLSVQGVEETQWTHILDLAEVQLAAPQSERRKRP